MGTLETSALVRAQEAKLQTNTDDNSELTIHTYADERGMRKEYWRRDKLLGSGGFGTVFREECIKRVGRGFEHDKEPGPLVRAVKQLRKPGGQASLSGELLRELNALVFFTGRQHADYFVQTYGWWETKANLFIAMEYLEKGDLQLYLYEYGPVSEDDSRLISKQMLRGLELLHQNNFVHRDIKPANLLIKNGPPTGEWWIKIADFGISKKVEQSRALYNTVCGTLGFLAPELLGFKAARGKELSQLEKAKAADIWAAGETIFQTLTNQPSFGDDMYRLGEYVQGRQGFPTLALAPLVSEAGISFIRRCMAPDPADRPSARAAVDELRWPLGCDNHESLVVTLQCKGKVPPFLLSHSSGADAHFIIIGRSTIDVWDVVQCRVTKAWAAEHVAQAGGFDSGSISKNGRWLCVTRPIPHPPLLFDGVTTLDRIVSLVDGLDEICSDGASKISTFHPKGRDIIIACGNILSRVSIARGFKSKYMCSTARAGIQTITSMQFTPDGDRLITGSQGSMGKFIIWNTSEESNYTFLQVIGVPSMSNLQGCVSIHASGPQLRLASQFDGHELWVCEGETRRWNRRIQFTDGTKPVRHQGAGRAVEFVSFSADGQFLTCNFDGSVFLIRTSPMSNVGCITPPLGDDPRERLGWSVFNTEHLIGATAASRKGGANSACVYLWDASRVSR